MFRAISWLPTEPSARLRVVSLVVAVCSSTALAIVAEMKSTCAITSQISAMAFIDRRVSTWIFSSFLLISSVALAVSLASSFTSLATTAKPLPASPARAASMVALSARSLVYGAIVVMTLITLPISALLSPSFVIVTFVSLAVVTAALATRAEDCALTEISRMLALISSVPAATS